MPLKEPASFIAPAGRFANAMVTIVFCQRKQLEILGAIVQSVAINMVHDLTAPEPPSDEAFHHQPMFIFSTAILLECAIAIAKSAGARLAAFEHRWVAMPLEARFMFVAPRIFAGGILALAKTTSDDAFHSSEYMPARHGTR